MTEHAVHQVLLHFLLPLWIVAGAADCLCHRASHIERTAGAFESALHLLMLVEMALPLLAGLFLEINALVLAVMLSAFVIHEATALWDVWYAGRHRKITPVEQHVHSFLELVPLMALVAVMELHWPQFLALFGLGVEAPDFSIELKSKPLDARYVAGVLVAASLLIVVPYILEFRRGLHAQSRRTEAE